MNVRERLRLHIRREYGTQNAFAEYHEVTGAYVSKVLGGEGTVPDAWLDEIGYEKEIIRKVIYRKKK